MNCRIANRLVVLDLYGELDAEDRDRLSAHLESCSECAAALSEIKRVLALVDEHSPAPDAVPRVDSERVWRRVRAGLASPPRPRYPRHVFGWRWGLAGASLAFALIAGIFLGRTWLSPLRPSGRAVEAEAGPALDQALSLHLDAAAPVLIDHLHRVDTASDEATLAEHPAVRALLLQNSLLRQALVERDPAAAELLDDLDLVFKEIITDGTKAGSVQDLIRERKILFRLRILKKNKEIVT